MAKVIIVNATEVSLKLEAKWRTGIGGDIHHSTSVTVKSFNSNYIDDVFYEMDFYVTNKDEEVYSNHGSIPKKDSFSYLAYRNSEDKNALYVGHHHKLTDSYPTRMLALAHAVYILKKIKDKTELQIKELKEKVKQLEENDMYIP